MLNLNKYIEKTVDITIGEEQIFVKLPSSKVMAEVSKIESTNLEKDIAKSYEVRQKVAKTLLSFNTANREFSDAEMDAIPLSGIDLLINEIMKAYVEVEQNPNSSSQSLAEK